MMNKLLKQSKKTYVIVTWTLFTSLLLTMSSYAWFSANRILGFHSFNIHVASKGGIEISTDAVNWKGVLALVDLIEARKYYPTSVNQVPYSLVPVSSAGTIENGYLKLFHGEVAQVSTTESYLVANRRIESEGFGLDSTGSFVAFDIFFKNISEKTLYLTPQSTISQLDATQSGIENAFRIAFLNQGTLPTSAGVSSFQRLNSADKAYIWEPNYDTHTQTAVDHALNVYGINTITNNANLLKYHGIQTDIARGEGVLVPRANATYHPDKFREMNVDIATRKSSSTYEDIFTIKPGVTKVRVYIWIEGQDVDCEDNSSIGDIAINLQLTTDPS